MYQNQYRCSIFNYYNLILIEHTLICVIFEWKNFRKSAVTDFDWKIIVNFENEFSKFS